MIHIEDLAQVRNVYPDAKYTGNYETVAALVYRGHDIEALREFTRRLAFNILISNGDAHLKNWSLIYRDPRIPTLSPAYDLVSTAAYRKTADGPESLGLKFGGKHRFDTVTLDTFFRLQQKLTVSAADLPNQVTSVVKKVDTLWPMHAENLGTNHTVLESITANITAHRRSLLRTLG